MEILNNFGFNVSLFVAQVINFLILAYLFKRFLYGPILNLLKQREEKIKQGLEDSEKARKEFEQARIERDKLLKETREESDKIIENTKALAEETREKMITEAKNEAERMIKQAREQGKIEAENLRKEAEKLTLDISKSVLDKIMTTIFTKEEREKILKRSIKDLSKYGQV